MKKLFKQHHFAERGADAISLDETRTIEHNGEPVEQRLFQVIDYRKSIGASVNSPLIYCMWVAY